MMFFSVGAMRRVQSGFVVCISSLYHFREGGIFFLIPCL